MAAAKPKGKKGLIIVLVVVAIVVFVIIIATRKKKDAANTSNINAEKEAFPLKYGDRSEYVANMQRWLLSQGAVLPKYGVDGIFGEETKAALISVTGKADLDYNAYLQIAKG